MIIVTARKNVTVRAYGPFTDFDTALRWAELNIADQSDEFSILEVELADGAATDGIEDYNNLARREAVR